MLGQKWKRLSAQDWSRIADDAGRVYKRFTSCGSLKLQVARAWKHFKVLDWRNMADKESPGAGDMARRTPQSELARKLHRLLDIAIVERGGPVSYPDIWAAMTVRGVKLSRARWAYMKDGNGVLVRDRGLLTALADYFRVDPDYLLSVEEVKTPAMTSEQLKKVKAFRAARVKSFVESTLGAISPETLDEIIDYLDRDSPPNHGGRETPGDSADNP